MHRISANNPVRRRLFSEEHTDEAKTDNFVNFLQESIATDLEQKKKKWNFDFEKELPLEGDYEWYRCDGPNDWIGIEGAKDTKTDESESEEDPLLQMKNENEVTPKNTKNEETILLVRKRKNDTDIAHATVKRKISFD